MKKYCLPLLFTLVFFLTASGNSQQRKSRPVELKKISTSVYEVLGGRGANGGAYIGDTGVLLIDSKMDKNSVDQTVAAIKKLTDKPITHLVNTHSDGDHIRGNKFLPESVLFIAHENCRKEFFITSDGSPSEWEKPENAPFIPSITFREKMDIYLGSKKVELWYFGVGHTTGDAVVYFPEEKIAFIGDQIFLGRPQLIHSYKGGNSFQHVRTLQKMLDTIAAETFCSGHSEEINREAIKKHILRMKEMQKKVRALMERGKDLESVKSAFSENEGRLVTAIFNEIKSGEH